MEVRGPVLPNDWAERSTERRPHDWLGRDAIRTARAVIEMPHRATFVGPGPYRLASRLAEVSRVKPMIGVMVVGVLHERAD